MITCIGNQITTRLSLLLRIGRLMAGSALKSFAAYRTITLELSSRLQI